MTENEQDHPGINKNIHPPVVTLFYIIAAYTLKWSIPIPYAVPSILRIAAFALMIIGFALAAAAFVEFRKAKTTLNPHGSVTTMATNGVYRFTRNPIYLGFLLMVIGFPLQSGTYWGLVIAPLFIESINSLVIKHEETYLERKFGKEYTEYKSRVRRWL